jgi:hypothetical protein
MSADHEPRSASRWTGLARRAGAAGILFFTVKGLLWLVIPALLYWIR